MKKHHKRDRDQEVQTILDRLILKEEEWKLNRLNHTELFNEIYSMSIQIEFIRKTQMSLVVKLASKAKL